MKECKKGKKSKQRETSEKEKKSKQKENKGTGTNRAGRDKTEGQKDTEKKDRMQSVRNIRRMLQVISSIDRHYFHLCMITHIINAAIPCITFLLSAYVLDGIASGYSTAQLIRAAALTLVAVFVLNCIASTVWHHCEVRRQNIYNTYQSMTNLKTLNMDYTSLDSPDVKKLKDQISRDNNWGWGINTPIFTINSLLFNLCSIVTAAFLSYPVLLYMLHNLTGAVTLLFLVTLGIVFVLYRVRSPWLSKLYELQQDQIPEEDREERVHFMWSFTYYDMFHYRNIKDIKLYNGHSMMHRWTIDGFLSKKNRDEFNKMGTASVMSNSIQAAISGILNGASYLIVTLTVLAGRLSVGSLVTFAGGLRRLFAGVSDLIIACIDLSAQSKKQCSTLDLLEYVNVMHEGKIPIEKRSDNQYQIEFRHVWFRYPGSDDYALKDLNLTLTIGEKLAVVGMNGSGKTTMIKLLCRLYDVTKGEILLNGVDIRKFDPDEYRRLFSVVFQDFHILPFTLAENVSASLDGDRKKILDCLEKAGLGKRLETLEHGMDTYLTKQYTDEGMELSGGELQKVVIARAIFKESPFVLLDEPTAALDPLAEYEIYSNFDRIVDSKTAIYISHRLSSCRFCEKIAVFHDGTLVQIGSHEQLIQDPAGKYYEMWNAQAQYYK